jgi:tetratricopeptide (TPR) repeat protein
MTDPDDLFSVKEFGQRVAQGKTAYKAGRFPEAIQAWKAAQAADPSRRGEVEGYLSKAIAKQAALHMEKARLAEAAGESDEALVLYRQVMALGLRDPAQLRQVTERIQAHEHKTEVMSRTLFLTMAGGFALFVVLSLWLILFKLD